MVEADPDVPHSLAAIVEELRQRRDLGELECLNRALPAEDGGACGYPVFQSQQSSVLRIEVGEETVTDFEGRHLLSSDVCKAHHRISAVAVVVDEIFGS